MKQLLLFALLLPMACFGRLGETQKECEERYGEFRKIERLFPGQDVYKTRIEEAPFTKAINLYFIDERCEGIAYICVGAWTESELEDLYKKNFGDKKWEIKKGKRFTRIVEDGGVMEPLGDDGLIVRNVQGEDVVWFMTPKLLRVYENEEKKKDEEKKQKPTKGRTDDL
jgi:hypothetical protein